jgi:hypothetical protein
MCMRSWCEDVLCVCGGGVNPLTPKIIVSSQLHFVKAISFHKNFVGATEFVG